MKIPVQKEFAIKKAIMIAIEKGESVSKMASYFGVSKSTIYKYRRSLRDQGFIIKNENDVYVIVENKFSKKPQTPKTAEFDFNQYSKPNNTKTDNDTQETASIENINTTQKKYSSIKEVPTSYEMEQRLQSKIEKMRDTYEETDGKKSVFKKLFSKFVKN